jgi:AraC-like DNA-binding protein
MTLSGHTGQRSNPDSEQLKLSVGVTSIPRRGSLYPPKMRERWFLSRSALAQRFAYLVGMPPIQYLAKWRMQIASGLLSDGSANVATVAAEIGYASEAVFSRAFKKLVGISPSDWRRRFTHDGSRPMLRAPRPWPVSRSSS